jgi:hypothetical protein
VLSLALNELIVGFTLSVYVLLIVILSVEVLPAASLTVKVVAAVEVENDDGLENDFVKV